MWTTSRENGSRVGAEALPANARLKRHSLATLHELSDGSPLHPKTLSWHFGSAVRRTGLPAIRLHDLRHSQATLALKAGVHPRVVQERLGHANVGVTLDTYSHVTMPMQAEAASLVAGLVTDSRKLL